MKNARYWIWLQACLGVPKRFQPIVEYFGDVKAIYEANVLQRMVCPNLSKKNLEKMETIAIEEADEIIALCEREGYKIITFDDEEYPNKLREIDDPPMVLFVEGDLPDIDNSLTLGVVGTREASPYALKVARVVSKGVARCNGVVISGGALGIDSSAHEGALEAKGKTIVVLGCGLKARYLLTNSDLRRRVSIEGAIISEYPPNTEPKAYTFPPRNRIISGLSDGVFVVEASTKSGSLITASYATSQNRDLFATASSIFDKRYNGTNKLIEDGATPVTSMEAVLRPYERKYKTLDLTKLATFEELLADEYMDRSIAPDQDEQITFENIEMHRENLSEINQKALELKGDARLVFDALRDDFEELSIIADRTGLEIRRILMSMTVLELDGLAEAGIGKKYRRKQA